jgi:Spinocerebellar ataxia type 10 protein domain
MLMPATQVSEPIYIPNITELNVLSFTVIKEWTILVIRNICDENQENQKFIASLTKMGPSKNSILEEFMEDSGVLRIKPST